MRISLEIGCEIPRIEAPDHRREVVRVSSAHERQLRLHSGTILRGGSIVKLYNANLSPYSSRVRIAI